MTRINANETMPSPVLPPPGSAFDSTDGIRQTAATGNDPERHAGLPESKSRRAMQRRAAEAPPDGHAPGPGVDGTITPPEQLESGGAQLPPPWAPGETAAEIDARRYPPGQRGNGMPGS